MEDDPDKQEDAVTKTLLCPGTSLEGSQITRDFSYKNALHEEESASLSMHVLPTVNKADASQLMESPYEAK